jgi:isocitrate dehydrogenase
MGYLKDVRVIGVIFIAAIAISYALGREAGSKERSETTNQSEQTKTEYITVVKEVVRPDGTKEKETTTKRTDETDKSKSSSTVVKGSLPDWRVSALYTSKQEYGVHVERRIIGTISAGAFGLNNGSYGLSVGMEF